MVLQGHGAHAPPLQTGWVLMAFAACSGTDNQWCPVLHGISEYHHQVVGSCNILTSVLDQYL